MYSFNIKKWLFEKRTHICWHNVVHQRADQSKLHWTSITKIKDDQFSSSSFLRITWNCKPAEHQQWRTDTNQRTRPQATSLFLCLRILVFHSQETLQGCKEESELKICGLRKQEPFEFSIIYLQQVSNAKEDMSSRDNEERCWIEGWHCHNFNLSLGLLKMNSYQLRVVVFYFVDIVKVCSL